ncbi:stage II sporulation protein M [Bacillus sp. AGMB 02131]|uniref:Stage II sporulation protein M n=1 Tax=Peribacillus faecalis TaxID=2772559 RepID=A0A927CYT1_9BACI|nr:stage II sporulation protein M [Peribacillus faecalis]MBD3109594.1 stage II sporulation protein M [Peribacillus faecalis]
MKKKMFFQNAAQSHIRDYSSLYIFIIVLFLMGVICGSIIVNSLSFMQKEDLLYYLTRFFGEVKTGTVTTSSHIFAESVKHNIQYIGLIWILGISIIGIPITLVLLFLKGMVVGFTVGFLVNAMSWEGFQIALVAVLPQNIILVPIMIFITTLSLALSMKIIGRVFLKQVRQPIKPILLKYMLSFVVCVIFIIGAGVIEAYFSPSLMKSIVS